MRTHPTGLACLAACLAALAACGDDGGTPPNDAAVDAPGGALTCSAYCDTIQANCTNGTAPATYEQYVTSAQCAATCALFPVGTINDTSGNTLGCRIYHAGVAGANPAMHCPHAGPGGDDVCGSHCAGFCQLVMGTCTGGNTAYATMSDCMTACSAFPTTPRYNTTIQGSNSFACRLYHATVATTNPDLHCMHVKATGGPCVDPPAAQ
jgi:hypothetical protein